MRCDTWNMRLRLSFYDLLPLLANLKCNKQWLKLVSDSLAKYPYLISRIWDPIFKVCFSLWYDWIGGYPFRVNPAPMRSSLFFEKSECFLFLSTDCLSRSEWRQLFIRLRSWDIWESFNNILHFFPSWCSWKLSVANDLRIS